jgi:hypothetical protein
VNIINRSLTFKIMLLVALLQGVFGLLRAHNWVQVGVDIFGQGILLLPFIGMLAVMRGLFISAVAALYVLFVAGALLGRGWGWWSGLTAVVVNLLLVVSALFQGAAVAEAVAWSTIPVILLAYLLSQNGRNALKGPARHAKARSAAY